MNNNPYLSYIPSERVDDADPSLEIHMHRLRLEAALQGAPSTSWRFFNLIASAAYLQRTDPQLLETEELTSPASLLKDGLSSIEELPNECFCKAETLFNADEWIARADSLDASLEDESEERTFDDSIKLLRQWDDAALILSMMNANGRYKSARLASEVDRCDRWQQSHLDCFIATAPLVEDIVSGFRDDMPAHLAWTARKFIRVLQAESGQPLEVESLPPSIARLLGTKNERSDILATITNWRSNSLTNIRLAASTDEFPIPAWSIIWENPTKSRNARLHMPRTIDQNGEVRIGFFSPKSPKKIAYDLVGASVWLDGIESRIELIEHPTLTAVARFRVEDVHKQASHALWLEIEGTPWLPADFQTPTFE